jgi:hypothetical protein
LSALVAGHLHLVGVDDDHIVAHVHVRREGRLVLAAQDIRDDRGKAAQNDAFGVDQDPLLLDVRRRCGKGFHMRGSRFKTNGRRNGRPGAGDGVLYDRSRIPRQAHDRNFIQAKSMTCN